MNLSNVASEGEGNNESGFKKKKKENFLIVLINLDSISWKPLFLSLEIYKNVSSVHYVKNVVVVFLRYMDSLFLSLKLVDK